MKLSEKTRQRISKLVEKDFAISILNKRLPKYYNDFKAIKSLKLKPFKHHLGITSAVFVVEYKIKYINDNTISLTVINCENDFFEGCGPFTLTNKTKTENNNSSNGSEIEVNQEREPESSESQSVDGVYIDHSGDFQSTVRINGNRFSWSSTMYGQQQPTSYGIVVNNDIYDETGSVIIGTIDPQRGTVRLRTACCGIITCSK